MSIGAELNEQGEEVDNKEPKEEEEEVVRAPRVQFTD